MKQQQKQQGDVLIHRIKSLPSDLKNRSPKNGSFVLAEGEATGHSHTVPAIEDVQLFEDEKGNLYLQVESAKPVKLSHQEHNPQMIDKGIYEIGQVVEVDPFEESINKVQD